MLRSGSAHLCGQQGKSCGDTSTTTADSGMALTSPREPQLKVAGSPVSEVIYLRWQVARQPAQVLSEDDLLGGGLVIRMDVRQLARDLRRSSGAGDGSGPGVGLVIVNGVIV